VSYIYDRKHVQSLAHQVHRKVKGWQYIWLTSLYDQPSVAKGRYIAAQEFYDWLQAGGKESDARAYLKGREAHWRAQREVFEGHLYTLQLNDAIAKGYETPAAVQASWPKSYVPGFTATEKEREMMQFLVTQYQASEIEVRHLTRFLAPDRSGT